LTAGLSRILDAVSDDGAPPLAIVTRLGLKPIFGLK